QAEDGIRDFHVTGVQTCALPISSQLTGMPETARRILARNVRLGRPLGVTGLPEAAKGPAFATTVGLLIYPQVASFESRYGKGGGDRKSVVQGKRVEPGGRRRQSE